MPKTRLRNGKTEYFDEKYQTWRQEPVEGSGVGSVSSVAKGGSVDAASEAAKFKAAHQAEAIEAKKPAAGMKSLGEIAEENRKKKEKKQ